MQHRLLQQEFWTPDVLQGLRTKVEQSYGPTMVAVFRDLALGRRAEGWSVGATNQSTFHTELIPGKPNEYYQTITTTPVLRIMSQEVCVSRKFPPSLVNKNCSPGTPPVTLSTESQDNTRSPFI